jgi:2-C-methyl-D-erythritol 4-phosphate cytidylyltransferase
MRALGAEAGNGAKSGGVCAIVLCAGQGTRMGAERNKVLLPLAGKPIVVHAIEACLRTRAVTEVLLVAHPREVEEVRGIVRAYQLARVRDVIPGGATRHASESCALNALRQAIEAGEVEIVLIHDGARPLVRPADITRLVRAAREGGGALLATPGDPAETIAQVQADGTVSAVCRPEEVWHAQTPQAFDAVALLRAYDDAARTGFEGTDTASSLERRGALVRVVKGSPDNIKITTPLDLARAEALLSGSARRAARVRDPARRH